MTTAADNDVQGALTTSFIFHGVVLLALIFGLPHMKPPPIEMVQPIAVDIIDVGPVTTTQVQGTGQIAKKTDLAPLPQPAKPQPKPQAAPAPPPPPAPPAPKVKPTDDTADQAALSKLIKNESKTAQKDEKATQNDQQFGSLLKNISNQKPVDTAADTKTPPANTQAAGTSGVVASKLTISEQDALRRQIEQCWNVPMGAKDAKNLVIDIHLEVNPDRTVKTAEITNTDQLSNPFFRAAAESARRAVLNPKCSPLALPADKYDTWKSMTMSFNPQDML